LLNSPNTSLRCSQASSTQCVQTRFPGHSPWLFLIISCYRCCCIAGCFAVLEHQGSLTSLSCAVPGRETQRDPIPERITVENPTVSGGWGSSGSALQGISRHYRASLNVTGRRSVLQGISRRHQASQVTAPRRQVRCWGFPAQLHRPYLLQRHASRTRHGQFCFLKALFTVQTT